MKICPKCGHVEDMSWRSRSNRAFCSYMKWEQFKDLYPDGAKALLANYPVPQVGPDNHFVYHITKTGLNVERIEVELYKIMGWGAEPQEKRTPGLKGAWERAPLPSIKKQSKRTGE